MKRLLLGIVSIIIGTTLAWSAGGPLLPSSIYLGGAQAGGAAGSLSPTFYVPNTNTNNAGAIEGIAAVASLATNAIAILQFNMPESIPTGVMKLRVLGWANATSGAIAISLSDGRTAAGSNIGAATLGNDTQLNQTWTSADVIVENKITLTTTPQANDVITVLATYVGTSTLAATSVWQYSIVWE